MTTTQGSEVFAHMTGRAVEAFSMVAEANQKILRDLVDLSASTAKEGVRLYAELLRRIDANARHVTRIASNLLDARRVKSNRVLVHRESADLLVRSHAAGEPRRASRSGRRCNPERIRT